jgi:hypothetical protein
MNDVQYTMNASVVVWFEGVDEGTKLRHLGICVFFSFFFLFLLFVPLMKATGTTGHTLSYGGGSE